MQVHHGEGIANHTGPKPCGASREAGSEASAGERVGQPLSHDIVYVSDADMLKYMEGNTCGSAIASARRSDVVVDPGMRGRSLFGNREISGPTQPGQPGWVRIGKARSRSR